MKQKLVIILVFMRTFLSAQTPDTAFTIAEFKGGYGISSFGEGLKDKYEAGNFNTSGGFLASLSAFHKFKKINNLVFGIKFKTLAASPSNGDNGQEMFFNYWAVATAIKYFPFDKAAQAGFYVQGDFNFITQFTQKYRTRANLEFNHQFAIGRGFTVGLGYDFPNKAKRTMFTVGFEYEYDYRRGEVTGIGFKFFESSNFGLMAGIKF